MWYMCVHRCVCVWQCVSVRYVPVCVHVGACFRGHQLEKRFFPPAPTCPCFLRGVAPSGEGQFGSDCKEWGPWGRWGGGTWPMAV